MPVPITALPYWSAASTQAFSNLSLLRVINTLDFQSSHDTIQFLLKNTGMFERLGIMTLSSILKKNNHEVNLILTEELDENQKKFGDIYLPIKELEQCIINFC